jgi:acyl-CoA synthetase (AMP-forming)/AMP-acid ligase II
LATLLENVAGLYAPLLNGSEVQLPSDAEIGLTGASLDIERFASLLNASQADTMILVPQLLTAVVTLVELGALTLSSFKLIAVGGGRIGRSLHDRAQALDLPVFEGYGLSECCSVLTLNLPQARRTGSVGRLLNHTTLRIAENGEIQVRSPQMDGYIGDSQSKQDWYSTGDLGHLDEDGYLYINGRARNVFITAFGRNVNPEWPEAALTQHAAIGQALVYGEAQDHNLGLLWLRFPQTDTEIAGLVAAANNELPDYAQIHQWLVIPGPLPAELQTANGRLKREAAIDHYGEMIESHYSAARPEAMISNTSLHPNIETLNERNHNVIL